MEFPKLKFKGYPLAPLLVILNEVKNLVLCPFTQKMKDEILRRESKACFAFFSVMTVSYTHLTLPTN